jgi:hypothetical protein
MMISILVVLVLLACWNVSIHVINQLLFDQQQLLIKMQWHVELQTTN